MAIPEPAPMNVAHFATASAFRGWLDCHHSTERELIVGFYRKESGRDGLTYPEALDEALCLGWIDGVRRRIDALSYSIRFTPRQPRSHWSTVNLRRVEELTRLGRMAAPGFAAHAARDPHRTARGSYEQDNVRLDPELERRFRAQRRAWAFFETQPPGYRRTALWWVVSAKREDTRLRRLATLIADSAAHRRLDMLSPSGKRTE